mmetsp:Transcript_74114/g.226703  ORF Transcript_74114/g.226703 Transcript_74114/m.226703 type:complete len:229 (+) Transcript_74114:1397-2083(+)
MWSSCSCSVATIGTSSTRKPSSPWRLSRLAICGSSRAPTSSCSPKPCWAKNSAGSGGSSPRNFMIITRSKSKRSRACNAWICSADWGVPQSTKPRAGTHSGSASSICGSPLSSTAMWLGFSSPAASAASRARLASSTARPCCLTISMFGSTFNAAATSRTTVSKPSSLPSCSASCSALNSRGSSVGSSTGASPSSPSAASATSATSASIGFSSRARSESAFTSTTSKP